MEVSLADADLLFKKPKQEHVLRFFDCLQERRITRWVIWHQKPNYPRTCPSKIAVLLTSEQRGLKLYLVIKKIAKHYILCYYGFYKS